MRYTISGRASGYTLLKCPLSRFNPEKRAKCSICSNETDKLKRKRRKLTPPPVKEFAISHGIPVLQPKKLSEPSFSETIRAIAPDYIVVVAYGRIIPPEIVQIPKKCPVNVH